MDDPNVSAAGEGGAASGMLNQPAGSPDNISDNGSNVAQGVENAEPQASAASLPAAGNRTPPPSPGAQPPPAPTHLNTFDKILDAMGARPKPTYNVDPATGKLLPGPPAPMTTKQRAGMVLAAALTGLAASQEQPGRKTGLSTFATGAGAGVSMAQGEDAEAKKEAVQANQRQHQQTQEQQETQLRQAQIFETNQRTALLSRQSENAAEDLRQKYIASSQPLIEKARGETAGGQGSLLREHLTQAQLLSEHSQDGARHATSNIYVPDGEIPVIDPRTGQDVKNADGSTRMEYTYAEMDPAKSVELDPAVLDEAVKNGMPVPGYTPGAGTRVSLPIGAAANLVHFNQGVDNFKGLVGEINSTLGLGGDKGLDPEAMLKRNPALGAAVQDLASHWDGVPSNLPKAMATMQADKKGGGASAAATISNAIGGDKLDAFSTQMQAKKDAAIEAAKSEAKEPAEEARENRVNANSQARSDKKEDEKDSRTYGSAFDPATGARVYTTLADANARSLQGFEEMKGGEIQKTKEQLRMWNDVQLNQSRYVSAANQALKTPPTTADYVNLHTLLNKAGAFDLSAALTPGGEIKLPAISAMTEGLSRETNSEAYHALTPQARALFDGYQRQLTAIPAFQKAMTAIGRTNKEMMDLELQFAPNPTWKPQDIVGRLGQFQENIDQGTQGLIKFVDLPLPKDIRKQYEGAPAASAQKPTAGVGGNQPSSDPFAAFGGRLRQPNAAAGASAGASSGTPNQ